MTGDERPQHISEQVIKCKKQLSSFSKFYSKLPDFLYKNKTIQDDILVEAYEYNSRLEALLRQIMELELNEETFRQLSHEAQQSSCTCSHCTYFKDKEPYFEDDEEDE